MDAAERFAANLIGCRENTGLSRSELATRAALDRTEIGKLERGEIADPHLATLIKLAGALDVPVGDLLAGIDVEAEPGEPAEGE